MLHVFCAIPRHKSCVLHWFKPAYVPWIFQRAHDVRTTCRSCYRCSLFLSCCKLHVCAGLSLLCPPLGEGDAEDAWLQRSEDVNTDHRTVHGRPSAGAVETAGHHHDRQVQTALGWAGWEQETHCTRTYCPINVHTPLCLDGFSKNRHKGVVFFFVFVPHTLVTDSPVTFSLWLVVYKSVFVNYKLFNASCWNPKCYNLCSVFRLISLHIKLMWQSAARRALARLDTSCSSPDRRAVPTAKHILTSRKTSGLITRTAAVLSPRLCCSFSNALVAAVVVVFVVDDDVRFLPLVLFCTLRGQRSDLICFNPTYFWKCVCVCTVSLKSTLQNLLPKSLSLPLMCGKCCLLAPLSFSLSLSPPRSLFCLAPLWVAATPLLQTQSLASFTCPHPCLLVHIIRAPISFSPLTPSFLHFLSVLRRVFFSLLILSMSLPSSFLPNSVCTHMHL